MEGMPEAEQGKRCGVSFVYVLFLSHWKNAPRTNMVRMIRIPSIVGSKLKVTTVEVTVTITGVEAIVANTMDTSCVLNFVVYHT
jgi:hypothetical protein